MDVDALKGHLQAHFSDGLVIVVGSGLSCAEGLPSMGALATRLLAKVPARVDAKDQDTWNALEPLINAKGLEPALFDVDISDDLQALIGEITGAFVAEAETNVLCDVFENGRTLRLSKLIPHLLKTQPAIPVVTTNYDRLIEAAFEHCGLGVDTMFVGDFCGELNEKEAALSQLREVKIAKNLVRRVFRTHVKLAKPHGSLDWYYRDGHPVRCTLPLPGAQRLIIAPGKSKFRTGYDSPFDLQRERANRVIDAASRFLVIGYGFNDDHLETHLTPAIKRGKPAVFLTYQLTPTAEALATECNSVTAIERRDADARSRVIVAGKSMTVDLNLWDLESFVKEVFAA